MTEEEILRKKLDRLNENSHYGIMIDTKITKIVRNLIKRLEDNEMKKATSVQTIENVNSISFSIEKYPIERVSKLTIVASTNDDIYEFKFEGQDILQSCKATDLFTGWEKDQEIRELKQKLQQAENDKKRLTYKLQENEGLKDKLENLKEEYSKLNGALNASQKNCNKWYEKTERLDWENKQLKQENERLKDKVEQGNKTECENCLAGASLVDDYLKLAKKNEQLTFEKAMIKKGNERIKENLQSQHKMIVELNQKNYKLQEENDKLKKELALEKAANEAQHKFFRQYTGKGTEVQFNYAIDDVKEVSYVIVDKEEYNKNFEKWLNAQVENAPASTSRADILDQAKKCVCGQREQDYGTPESNFQLIADLWTDYLYPTLGYPKKDAYGIKSEDVAMMMALMKIARIRNGGGSGDSFVDLAGYAACGGEIWHGQKVKDQN